MNSSPTDGPEKDEPDLDQFMEDSVTPPMPSHLEVKVDELTPHSKKVFIRLKVVDVEPPQTVDNREGGSRSVTEAVVGDGTGIIRMTLWDDEARTVNEGETVEIHNGYVGLLRGHMRLYIGRYGKLHSSQEPIQEVNLGLDLCELEYRDTRPPDRFGGGGRDRRGGGGGRNDRRGGGGGRDRRGGGGGRNDRRGGGGGRDRRGGGGGGRRF